MYSSNPRRVGIYNSYTWAMAAAGGGGWQGREERGERETNPRLMIPCRRE